MPASLRELASNLSLGRVTDDPELLPAYETPERGEQGSAAFLVEPGSHQELSAVAAWAYGEGQRLVIQGANSGLVEASTPDSTGEQGVLGVSRMARLLDFDPSDRIAVVEGGIRLDTLNSELSEAGQFFPIEVGSNPTMGGLLATNAGGARTICYGDAGSRVLGLEAVIASPEGSTLGAPRKLVKDNSRLRIDRLFVGSFGALGVISRAAVRTAIRPRSTAAAFVRPSSHHAVPDILVSFEQSFEHDISAYEFISGDTVTLARSTTPNLKVPLATEPGDLVLVEVASATADGAALEESLALQLDLTSQVVPNSIKDAVVVPPSEAWAMRHALSEGVMRSGATIRFDVSVPRRLLPELRDFVLGKFSSDSLIVSEFGHWGDGGTHLSLVYPDRVIPDSQDEIRETIYDEVVVRLGGSFSSEHGLGRHNARFYERYVPETERLLATRLKALLDPKSVWGSAPFSGR